MGRITRGDNKDIVQDVTQHILQFYQYQTQQNVDKRTFRFVCLSRTNARLLINRDVYHGISETVPDEAAAISRLDANKDRVYLGL